CPRALTRPRPSSPLFPYTPRFRSHRDDDDESDLPSRIDEAIEALWREKPGDVLVFLPGEREIRDVADHLRRLHARELAARSGSPDRQSTRLNSSHVTSSYAAFRLR